VVVQRAREKRLIRIGDQFEDFRCRCCDSAGSRDNARIKAAHADIEAPPTSACTTRLARRAHT